MRRKITFTTHFTMVFCFLLIVISCASETSQSEQSLIKGYIEVDFSQIIKEITSPERHILGVWEYGFGVLSPYLSARSIEFLEDGIYIANTIERTWELNEDGQLVMECWFMPDDSVVVLDVEVEDDRLILRDVSGNTRSWRRPGTQVILEDLDFLGVWEFEHGATLDDVFVGGGSPLRIEFFADGSVRAGEYSERYWELDENGNLVIEAWGSLRRFIIDVDGNRMMVEDDQGYVGFWMYENTREEGDQHWLIMDYLGYFDIEEGYHIVNNLEVLGDQFDFVIYDLRSIEENERGFIDWYFMVVVKQDDMVLDVLHHPAYPPAQPGIHRIVVEVDINFDGLNDVLLFQGHIGNAAWRNYFAWLQTDNGLEEVALPGNPWLDRAREVVLSAGRSGAAWHAWREDIWIDNQLMTVAELERDAWEIGVAPEDLREGYRLVRYTERLLVDGQWQVRELCVYHHMVDFGFWHGHEVCDIDNYDAILYDRLFGENPYWDQRFHAGPSTWDE